MRNIAIVAVDPPALPPVMPAKAGIHGFAPTQNPKN